MQSQTEQNSLNLKGSEIMMLRFIVTLVSSMFSIIRPGITWLIYAESDPGCEGCSPSMIKIDRELISAYKL